MGEDHLQNILKIMAYDDYDEMIVHRLHIYVRSRGLLPDFGMGPTESDVLELNALLAEQPEVKYTED